MFVCYDCYDAARCAGLAALDVDLCVRHGETGGVGDDSRNFRGLGEEWDRTESEREQRLQDTMRIGGAFRFEAALAHRWLKAGGSQDWLPHRVLMLEREAG